MREFFVDKKDCEICLQILFQMVIKGRAFQEEVALTKG